MAAWDSVISRLPGAHALQTTAWAHLKQRYGWQPFFACWDQHGTLQMERQPFHLEETPSAAGLFLERTLRLGGFAAPLRVIYLPRGPLLDWSDTSLRQRVLDDLRLFAHRRQAIFIKLDPDVPLGYGVPGEASSRDDPVGQAVMADLQAAGWRYSSEQIQFRNTVVVDLQAEEDALLGRMKQKTRYNIRLAARKGVSVRLAGPEDFSLLYRMYAETSLRDGFVIRDEAYYRQAWTAFIQAGMADPLLAEAEGKVVAAIFLVRFARRAWYLYGMSTENQREKMPNHLLQWEAMRRARLAGCLAYDLWGAPEVFDASDRLWGVYRFKEGLGGQVVRGLGAWDLPTLPFFYRLYTEILPRWLTFLRRQGKTRTAHSLVGS